MKKLITVFYLLWIIGSIAVFGKLLFDFYPDYSNMEFLMFTDIGTLIFMPSYFILSWLAVHFLDISIKKASIKISICFLLLTAVFVYSFKIMDFKFLIESIISLTGIIVGFVHYFITMILFKNSCFSRQLHESSPDCQIFSDEII